MSAYNEDEPSNANNFMNQTINIQIDKNERNKSQPSNNDNSGVNNSTATLPQYFKTTLGIIHSLIT